MAEEKRKRSPGEPKKANSVDAYVGMRIRARRMALGMSQDSLADKLGLTFQQVQKYEKGINRVGAGRLWNIAKILDVPITHFYQGLQGDEQAAGVAESGDTYIIDFMSSHEGAQLARAFQNIKDPGLRKRMLDLIKSLAEDPAAAEKTAKLQESAKSPASKGNAD
jgi:transcriptional regulator with XRE-family HTH domain